MNDESSKHMPATRHADLVRRVLPEWRTIFDPPIQTTATTLQEAAGDGWNACLNQMRANLATLASQPAEQPRGEVLDAPAKVGAVVFNKGTLWSSVVACAQRAYVYKDQLDITPEQAAAFRQAIQPKPEQAAGDGVAYTDEDVARCEVAMCSAADPDKITDDLEFNRACVRAVLDEFTRTPRPAVATPAEVTELRRALTGLLVDHDLDHGPGACGCRLEPENAGHTCSACLARTALASPSAGAVVPEVVTEVMAEVERAIAKFPTWPTDPLHALGVVGEEFGELGKAVLQQVYEPHKNQPDDVRKEAVQTAAMAIRFLASLSTYQYAPGVQHQQPMLSAAPEAS